MLAYTLGQKEELDTIGQENTDEKIMLRNVIITASLRIYLGRLFGVIQQQEKEKES